MGGIGVCHFLQGCGKGCKKAVPDAGGHILPTNISDGKNDGQIRHLGS